MPETPRPFLDITQSVTGRAWVDRLDASVGRTASAIGQRAGVSDILARILAGRGVGIDDAESWLEPTIRGLMPDPSTLTAMDSQPVWLAALPTMNPLPCLAIMTWTAPVPVP